MEVLQSRPDIWMTGIHAISSTISEVSHLQFQDCHTFINCKDIWTFVVEDIFCCNYLGYYCCIAHMIWLSKVDLKFWVVALALLVAGIGTYFINYLFYEINMYREWKRHPRQSVQWFQMTCMHTQCSVPCQFSWSRRRIFACTTIKLFVMNELKIFSSRKTRSTSNVTLYGDHWFKVELTYHLLVSLRH